MYYLDLDLLFKFILIFLMFSSFILFLKYKNIDPAINALIQPFFSGILLGFVGFKISPNIMENINLYIYIFMMILGVSFSIILENLCRHNFYGEFIYIITTGILTGILLFNKWEFTCMFAFITISIILLDLISKLKHIILKSKHIVTTFILFFIMIFIGFISNYFYNLSSVLSGFITGVLLYYLCTKIVLDSSHYLLSFLSVVNSIFGLFIGIYILNT